MSENLICELTDKDLGLQEVEMDNPRIRTGARGIVIRDDGKIALFYKSNKNEYKLPGGGIEDDETPEEAFKREVLEETGCIVSIVRKLGITKEYKSKDNFMQTSHVFLGEVIEDTKMLHITKKESDEGALLVWEDSKKALELIENCYDKLVASSYDSTYFTKFVVLRDRNILKYYLEGEVD